MSTYQIPQFLDSGDKILLGMNLRQFGYALGFGLTSVLVYSLLNSSIPGIGPYAIVPCIPLIGIGSYFALGKYNGRDSEIYVLKFFLYNTKPKTMVYARQPSVDDLNQELASLNYQSVLKKWTDRIANDKAKEKNSFMDFGTQEVDEKIRKIQSLKKIVDENPLNAIQSVMAKEQELAQAQSILQSSLQAKKNLRNGYQPAFNPYPEIAPNQDLIQKADYGQDQNYFDPN